MKILHISDCHLSERRPFFHHNWEVLLDTILDEAPDLVICSGDMSIDGSHYPNELAYAAAQFGRIGTEVAFVPGNHDIGNSIPDVRGGEVVITQERREIYLSHFGPDFWVKDLSNDWRLVGLNSMLPGSMLRAESEQNEMLVEAVATRGERKVVIVQHKPLYMRDPAEEKLTQGALYPAHRLQLKELLEQAGQTIVLSGHIHDYLSRQWGQIQEIWAPSTAFVIDGTGRHNPRYGTRRVGYLSHEISGKDIKSTFVEPASLIGIDLGNWMRAEEGFHAKYGEEKYRGNPYNMQEADHTQHALAAVTDS